ncbi:hypothetical protein ACPESR_32165 [Nocardia testacea]|uniref:hypothetical protein n=1 Tax=Nocardia testacea TaxID=248551 RepID=UPI003C2C32BE
MKALFRMVVAVGAVGIGCALSAGPVHADEPWVKDVVCGHGYQYGKVVDLHGQKWKIVGVTGNGQAYVLTDDYGRTRQVSCA